MPTIRLEKATKLYKWERRQKREAVSKVDLTIEQGEFVFLVGSSGAGKSTVLKLMTGEIKPDDGAVYLDKLNMNRVPPWYTPVVRQAFGQVRQESQFMRRRTVRENLMMVARAGGNSWKVRPIEKVEKALGIVGMSKAIDRFPGELSIGQSRRVELARALINSPSILILDELTANLDEDNIWDMLHLLTELNRQGTTVVMATHASMFVNLMRRRVVTLIDGKIAGDVRRGKYGELKEPMRRKRIL